MYVEYINHNLTYMMLQVSTSCHNNMQTSVQMRNHNLYRPYTAPCYDREPTLTDQTDSSLHRRPFPQLALPAVPGS